MQDPGSKLHQTNDLITGCTAWCQLITEQTLQCTDMFLENQFLKEASQCPTSGWSLSELERRSISTSP